MRSASVLALAASLSSALAQYKGFNYGSTAVSGAAFTQNDFQNMFTTAQSLVGTSGFSSARLYTMIQGGTTDTVISAIPAAIATKTSLLLGLWASEDQNAFNSELTALKNAISQYGAELAPLLAGISVGSEDLYRISPPAVQAGSVNPGQSPDTLVSYINQVRSAIAGTALSGASIGHVDTWTAWVNGSNSEVVNAVDWVGVDAYPYFQNTQVNGIDQGASLLEQAIGNTTNAANGKPIWITETGWPVSGPTENLAVADIANAQAYWDQVGCDLLFGKYNTWWYTLQDYGSSPSFGVVGQTLSNTPLYDLSCSASGSSSSSSSAPVSVSSVASATVPTTVPASATGSATVKSPIPGPSLGTQSSSVPAGTSAGASAASSPTAASSAVSSVVSSASSALSSVAASHSASAPAASSSAQGSAAPSSVAGAASPSTTVAAVTTGSTTSVAAGGKTLTIYQTTLITITSCSSGCPTTMTTGATSAATSAVVSASATGSSAAATPSGACPADINGDYQYPHLIVPVSSSSPNAAYGTSYNGTINSTVSSIFNFDIPASYAGKTCSLVFLFPELSQLETSSYSFNGQGGLVSHVLSSTANQSTTYANQPSQALQNGAISSLKSGNSYVISSDKCPGGATVSFELSSTGGLALDFFEDYNPSPLGLYVRAC